MAPLDSFYDLDYALCFVLFCFVLFCSVSKYVRSEFDRYKGSILTFASCVMYASVARFFASRMYVNPLDFVEDVFFFVP